MTPDVLTLLERLVGPFGLPGLLVAGVLIALLVRWSRSWSNGGNGVHRDLSGIATKLDKVADALTALATRLEIVVERNDSYQRDGRQAMERIHGMYRMVEDLHGMTSHTRPETLA